MDRQLFVAENRGYKQAVIGVLALIGLVGVVAVIALAQGPQTNYA
jgi:hypothetical protein